MKHRCQQQGILGELLWICSRCGGCYVCKHRAVYMEVQGKWMWKCKDGKFREAIFDSKLQGPPMPEQKNNCNDSIEKAA